MMFGAMSCFKTWNPDVAPIIAGAPSVFTPCSFCHGNLCWLPKSCYLPKKCWLYRCSPHGAGKTRSLLSVHSHADISQTPSFLQQRRCLCSHEGECSMLQMPGFPRSLVPWYHPAISIMCQLTVELLNGICQTTELFAHQACCEPLIWLLEWSVLMRACVVFFFYTRIMETS